MIKWISVILPISSVGSFLAVFRNFLFKALTVAFSLVWWLRMAFKALRSDFKGLKLDFLGCSVLE